ncbi:hypothetical protein [Pseudomonas entomophila]|uniref:hypothetical protein n=1 Tax=Pseudomonas entomophila TaxID=312306 RepID=UPI00200F20D5|nr:hypothetical protein [Pseudomonas entomophila]
MKDADKIKQLENDLASTREALACLGVRLTYEESQRALAVQALAQRVISLESMSKL